MLLEHYHTQDWTQSRQQSLCSIFRSILLHPKSLNHYNNVPCLAFKNGVSKLSWRVKKHPLRNPPPHSALTVLFFYLFVCVVVQHSKTLSEQASETAVMVTATRLTVTRTPTKAPAVICLQKKPSS